MSTQEEFEEYVVNCLVFPNAGDEEDVTINFHAETNDEKLKCVVKLIGDAAMSHVAARHEVQHHADVVSQGFELGSTPNYVADRIRELIEAVTPTSHITE